MGIYDTLKDVVSLVQKTDNIELVKHVLTLQAEALEMQAENRSLLQRVKELEQKLTFGEKLRFEAPLYYAEGDKIPFCARCWEVDHIAVHLKGAWRDTRWECYRCKNVYLLDE